MWIGHNKMRMLTNSISVACGTITSTVKMTTSKLRTFFRRALAIDPQYPQATAALAIVVLNAAYLNWAENVGGNYAEAYELALRSGALDARYPMAHFALGLVNMWTGRTNRAAMEFQEAVKLDPSFTAAHVLLGQTYLHTGRPEDAIAQAERGIGLSPYDPRLFAWLPALAGAHYRLEHYAEPVETGLRSWMLNRNSPAGLRYAVAGLAQLGRHDEAKAALADLRQLDPSLSYVESVLQRTYRDPAAIDRILDGLRKAGWSE